MEHYNLSFPEEHEILDFLFTVNRYVDNYMYIIMIIIQINVLFKVTFMRGDSYEFHGLRV